ncbi:MAG: peptide chain release factor-like protein [Christensenellales bacterium]
MELLDVEIIELLDAKVIEYNEANKLLEYVEIVSDNKQFMHYLNVQKSLKNIVNLYNDFKFFIEEDKLDGAKRCAIELRNELFKNEEKLFQNVKIEISAKSSNILSMLMDMILLVLGEECTKGIKSFDSKVEIIASGINVFTNVKNYIGIYQILNKEEYEIAKIVALEEKTKLETFDEKLLSIKTTKASGAGGQHINRTLSAVVVKHLPTQITVKVQKNRSQYQNKEEALKLIREKVEKFYIKQNEELIKLQRKNIEENKNKFSINLNKGQFKVGEESFNLNDVLNGKILLNNL